MTAHAVVSVTINRPSAEVFDLIHDYPRRLTWDTLLRKAVLFDVVPAVGAVAACSAKWWLGGLTFRTRYVTFDRPHLAAVTLTNPVFVFARWAASIRHKDLAAGGSTVTYTLTFSCRPRWAAPFVERVALAAFELETGRRLKALKGYLEQAGARA